MERANVSSARGRGRCTCAMGVSVLLQIEKRTEEEEGVPGLGLRKKNKMGLSGEPGPRGKWKDRMKKIEVGMVQIGLGHNYNIIFFGARVLKQQIK